MVICYGTRFTSVEDPVLLDLLDATEKVSTLRSTNRNLQDYVPLLRLLPNSPRTAQAKEAVDEKTAAPCTTESLLNDSSKSKLTLDDLKAITVSLVSGGFETMATTSSAALGFLATQEGQAVQDRFYDSLMSTYGSVTTAWDKVVVEEENEYTVALVREMLRYYAPIQFLPQRKTEKPFLWEGITIPKGITVIQNAQSINHDKGLYGEDADKFRPERWLKEETQGVSPPPAPYHYAFGAGSRACPAIAISNRLLYTTFARLILLFRVQADTDGLMDTNYITYNRDPTLQTCKPKDHSFRLILRSEDEKLMEECFQMSRQ
ncbi:unnamed protein product [Clonostachys rosea]|uniref:Cytochrome P450 n=1 Tax=Bionectria ochroleuca TaxID=29856 RepID=A0ABY6U7G0_BIOOC|nr:unnamed protein product [Clonostachys rosea]